MLRLTGVATVGAMVGMSAASPDSRELFASIAAGDQQPLAQLQTAHATDLALGRLAAAGRPALWRLARWADDGDSDILRANAAGVLAKTGDLEFAGLPDACGFRLVRAREGHGAAFSYRIRTELAAPLGRMAAVRLGQCAGDGAGCRLSGTLLYFLLYAEAPSGFQERT
jgi:hypothetical protein